MPAIATIKSNVLAMRHRPLGTTEGSLAARSLFQQAVAASRLLPLQSVS
jgi:hypothetical protein